MKFQGEKYNCFSERIKNILERERKHFQGEKIYFLNRNKIFFKEQNRIYFERNVSLLNQQSERFFLEREKENILQS